MSLLTKIFKCLTSVERRQSIVILALLFFVAALEVVGIASVMPFLAVLANPDLIETNRWISRLYVLGGFQSAVNFLTALGVASFSLLLFSAGVRSGAFYAQSIFVQMRRHSLSCRLLSGYLNQPYEFFLDRHSGDMAKNILSEVDMFVDRALMPMGQVFSYALVMILLVGFLFFVNPMIALVMVGVLGGSYVAIYWIVRKLLYRDGKMRLEANQQRFEAATEALGGIKSIKILGREDHYLKRFSDPSFIVARRLAVSNMISQIPRFVVEAVAFGGIILIALHLTIQNSGDPEHELGSVLSVLGLYAFAGYRLLPAVQNIYLNVTALRFAGPIVETIFNELESASTNSATLPRMKSKMKLGQLLTLENIDYHYPNANGHGIKCISLSLKKGASLGIIGTTGAGKTTLVDVIMGLLTPTTGQLLVDGIPITDANRHAWQSNLGYVPQEIYLTDNSVAENIAMGFSSNEIDIARVQKCAHMAKIHDFIVEELEEGYSTRVGERGVRLSGGQRQRIGIARALYRDPEVIIFDEATSALDNDTEAKVIDAIEALSGQKTLIIIAHRMSTVEMCDTTVQMERGKVISVVDKVRF